MSQFDECHKRTLATHAGSLPGPQQLSAVH
jgi:hypothetical protein